MSMRHLLACAVLTALAGVGNAQPVCSLGSHSIATGSDPINHIRVALRQDGRPALAYTNDVHNASSLFFYDCDDGACSSGHIVTLDTSSNYFGAPGIVVRPDGRPAITAPYFGGLRYYDCADADCSTFAQTDILPTGSAIGSDLPLALQVNGFPMLLYLDDVLGSRPNYLIAHFCGDAGCTSATEQVLDVPADGGSEFSELSLAVGSDGHPAVTYLTSIGASNSYVFDIARCGDAACASVTRTQLAGPLAVAFPFANGIAIRSDQKPLALETEFGGVAMFDCSTIACNASTPHSLPVTAVGQPIGLQLLSDNPLFALFAASTVGVFACSDATCSGGSLTQTSSTATAAGDADFALDTQARAAIAYIDADTRTLSAAGCLPNEIFTDGFQ
jgi:hypothetical protein